MEGGHSGAFHCILWIYALKVCGRYAREKLVVKAFFHAGVKERINDAEVDNAMRVKSLENVSDPLAKADEYLKALELQYETLEATQKDTEKQRLEAAEAKYSAAERLAALDKSLDCSVELEDFRWVSDLVESMTDLMSEKRLAVSLASQALEGLEKDYAEAL